MPRTDTPTITAHSLSLCPPAPSLHHYSLIRRLSSLNTTARTALGSLRMPTTRNEDYRYTDISPLLKSTLTAAPTDTAVDASFISDLVFPEVEGSTLVMVNGRFRPELSNMGAVPEGVYIGGAEGAPAAAVEQLVREGGGGAVGAG